MPELKENKERFLGLLRGNVKRDGVNELIDWLLASDFFTAPASTRHHGAYQGGLLEHSLNVFDCLVKQLAIAGLTERYDMESVVIVSLLHDICKVNFYKKGFRNVKDEVTGQWYKKEIYEIDEKFPCGDHADKSIIILQSFIRLEPEEILAIRAHMGGWDNAVRGGGSFINRIFETSHLAACLHLADMMATYILEG